ncbi:hypothetical protein J7K44_02660 [bacterium]|nr:hypothetical protein [bacterium]
MNYLYFYKFFIVLIVLIDIIGAWLAYLVYRNNPKGKINRLFIVMTIFMFIWVTFAASARILAAYGFNLEYSLFLLKIAWYVTPLLFLALYLFSVFIIKEEKRYASLTKVIFLLNTLAAFSVLTNLILADIRFSRGVLSFVYGKGIVPFLAVIAFTMFTTLYLLFKKYPTLAREEKKRMQFYLIGIFIFYLANIIFNILLPMVFHISQYYYLGDFSLIFLLGFIAYSISRYEFLGIKVILTELLVALIGIILIIVPFFVNPFWLKLLLGLVFVLFCIFGYLLIQSVMREIRQKEILEEKVKERTKELQAAYEDIKKRKEDLEKFYKLTIGRELRMIELKQKIKELEKEIKKERNKI